MRAVAIVNGNARRVRGRLRARLERAVASDVRVRFTHSLEEARAIVRAEVARGQDLIVLGGGDGTVVMGLALIAEACRGAGRPEPAVGVLRLGSGNAIADTLGASNDVVADLGKLVRGAGHWCAVPMIDVLGVRAPFVGVGVDAQLLEDQEAIGRVIDRVPVVRALAGGATRYTLSVALRSMPRFAFGQRPHAIVRNAGAPAIVMDRGGETRARIANGDELWRGACTLVAGATIPFFGFGLKMFAFAGERANRFHLRCGDARLLEILRSAPAAFRGEYFSDSVRDFLCERVEIELDPESAIEAGGELLGRRTKVALALAPPVTMVAWKEIRNRGTTVRMSY